MKTLFLFSLLIIPVCLAAQTPVSPGPVSGTWDLSGSPYMVNGEIYIHEDSTLVIEPGVEVRFTGWYKFIVYGSLMAEGTETDTIVFTASNTNNPWYGIRFLQTNKTSLIGHCIIEYGMTELSGTINTAENSGGGIICYQSPEASITIANSILRNNQAWGGGGLFCIETGALIKNCEIINNSSIRWGGGIDVGYNQGNTITVSNCLIAHNYSGRSGGGISLSHMSCAVIKENTIMYNTGSTHGGGMRIYFPSDYTITGNLIAKNQTSGNGGGIQFYGPGSVESLSDNTIVYNNSLEDGGGIWLNTDCTQSFTSDIIYFNLQNGSYNQVHLFHVTSQPTFSYCDVQDGFEGFTGAGSDYFDDETQYINCIEGDPLFVDPVNNDFNLSWTDYPDTNATMSPCIDKGCPGIFPAPDGTCNDIGAYDYFQFMEIPIALDADSVTSTGFRAQWSYANPATGYKLDVAKDAEFTVWVLENQVVDGDTSYYVENLDPDSKYYFRVRAFNSSQTSEYSDTADVTTLDTRINTFEQEVVNMYASKDKVYLNIETANTNGLIWVFDLAGKLLVHQGLVSGNNVIDPSVTDQIVIVRVVIDGKMYHRKLYVH